MTFCRLSHDIFIKYNNFLLIISITKFYMILKQFYVFYF